MTTGRSEKASEARCAGWRAIPYTVKGDATAGETHGDTIKTIQVIRVHNQTGLNKKCPRFTYKKGGD